MLFARCILSMTLVGLWGLSTCLSALNEKVTGLNATGDRPTTQPDERLLSKPQRGPYDRRMDSFNDHMTTAPLMPTDKNFAIQVTACVIAGASLVAAMVTCYWFSKMKKVFRHRLIFILIIADIIRSLWLFLFPVVAFVMGPIETTSGFCQASGFFTQMGYEMADCAVLFMALHTALQVFRPQPTVLGQGGLYRFRYGIYTFVAIMPPTMSALAFTSRFGYMSQGPVCSLPVRPFWHRLAISWIPRYVNMLTIVILYLAINIHAENQFTDSIIFQRRIKIPSRWKSRYLGRAPPNSLESQSFGNTEPSDARLDAQKGGTDQSIAGRRPSNSTASGDKKPKMIKWFNPGRSRRSRNGSGIEDLSTGKDSASEDINRRSSQRINSVPGQQESNANGVSHVSPLISREMRKKRRAIRRQLRLLFVYPLVYFVTWLVPFVQNVLNYSDYRAQHPFFVMLLLTYASISSMGLFDMIVFDLREKPWRHIPGNDGTFVGSFKFWQFDSQIGTRGSILESTASSPRTLTTPMASHRRRLSTASLSQALDNIPAFGGHDPLAGRRGSAADGIDERLWGDTIHKVNGLSCWDFGSRNDTQRHSTIVEGASDEEEPPSEPARL